MQRPRIESLLDQAACNKLAYVTAGAGYGKTLAVSRYTERRQDAFACRVQFSGEDNEASHFWETFADSISFGNPETSARLRGLGFPETPACFEKLASILRSETRNFTKTFFVLDDFHHIRSEEVLAFIGQFVPLHIPGARVLILSRKEPELNVAGLLSMGKICVVTEDDLRFTSDEIMDFFKLHDVPFSARELPEITGATGGRALSVQLLLLALKKVPDNLDHAIGIMRQNIYSLMEKEAFGGLPEHIQKTLVKTALVYGLPPGPPCGIFGDISFLQDKPELASFIWRDSLTGEHSIQPLYLEFLQSKHDILSAAEKQDIYRKAAQWCSGNNCEMDAMRFYGETRQYQRMLAVLFSFPFRLPPGKCGYLAGILESLAQSDKEHNDESVLFLKHFFLPLMLAGTGRYEEAAKRTLDAIREWEHSDSPAVMELLCACHSNLAYFNMYSCVETHEYDFPEYLEKAAGYSRRPAGFLAKFGGPFTVADVRSFACLVGDGAKPDEFERFLEAAGQAALFIPDTFHCMYSGYGDLAACELAFFRNHPDTARTHASRAILKAREKKQYSIEAMAEWYLLRIAMQEGDYLLVKGIMKQMRGYLENPDFWNRQLLYDLFSGFFYAQAGFPGMAPLWLAAGVDKEASDINIPALELIVCAKIHIAGRKYAQALSVLCLSYPREPEERFLFGELTLSLLLAVARIKAGDKEGAVRDFEKAYSLSFDGEFETPFIELGRDLHTLAEAVLKLPDCGIPKKWLNMIVNKSSAYAKKAGWIADNFRKDQKIEDGVHLSEREQEALYDLYHGLSREEIAANRRLSINTVKKTLQSLYIKLDAGNNVDAVRIALKKKLIE